MTVASKELIRKVFGLAAAEFGKRRWTKRKIDIFSFDFSDDIYGRVGLNKAIGRGKGVLEINPIVGVGSRSLEQLVAKLLGHKYTPYAGSAIGRNIGYLTPQKQYLPWLFHGNDDCQALVQEMVATIEKFGYPFMREHKELSALYLAMRNSGLGGPHDQYRIPTACLLLGRNAEAEEFVEEKLKEIDNRRDMDAQCFRSFATKLHEFIKLHNARN